MRAIALRLSQVEAKLKAVEVLKSTTPDFTLTLVRLRDPGLNRATHCSVCCLPNDKHVSHNPPDIEKPSRETSAKDWAPFNKALRAHYRAALKTLKDGELLTMPLPISKIRLMGIADELRERNEKAAPSRYTLIASDDDDFP